MINQVLADEILSAQLDLMRYEAHVRTRVLGILTQLQVRLTREISAQDLTTFNKQRTQAMLTQVNSIIDEYYVKAAVQLSTAATGAAEASASHATTALKSSGMYSQLAAGLPTETFLSRLVSNVLLQGAASADWWSRQKSDTQFRFANALRLGMAQGETNEQIVARIAGSPRKGITGVMDVARSNARSLVHTSIQAVANAARLESFRKNSDVIDHVVWLATLDGSTCPLICAPRDLKRYTLMDEPPQPIGHVMDWNGGPGAIHWGCRCIATAGTKSFAELGVDLPEPKPGQRASISGPVPATMTFEQFLKRKGKAFQEDVLGVGRAQLWRDGKLTLTQLLDLRGNPLTLKQLRSKYGN